MEFQSNFFLPKELNINKLYEREKYLVITRWLFTVTFLLLFLLFKSSSFINFPFQLIFLILAIVYNILVSLALKIKFKTSLSFATFLLDTILISFLVSVSGGINSDLWILYFFLLISLLTLFDTKNFIFSIIYVLLIFFFSTLPTITAVNYLGIFFYKATILSIFGFLLSYLTSIENKMRKEAEKVALENAQLYERMNKLNEELQNKIQESVDEIKRKYNQLEILYNTHKLISSDIELDKILSYIIKGVQEGLGFDRVGIFEVDEQHNYIRGRLGVDEWGKPENIENQIYSMDENDNNFAKIYLGKMEYFYTDNADKTLPPSQMKYMIKGVGQNVVVPMKARGKVIGMIAVDNFISKKPITQDDIKLLMTFADQAANAIYNARLYNIEKETAERLKKLEDEKNEFIAKMSHELKTPLTSINESIKIILKRLVGDITPNQEKFLTIAKNNSERLARLITELFDAVSGRTQQINLEISKVNMKNLLDEIITNLNPQAETKKVKINKLYDKCDVFFNGDYNKLYRAISNVIENAIKYNKVEGEVNIVLRKNEDRVLLEIEDTGIGIDPSQIDKIFEKFYQIKDPALKYHSGVGLGLSIAKEIIESHNGKITVESQGRGYGTKFLIIL